MYVLKAGSEQRYVVGDNLQSERILTSLEPLQKEVEVEF
jgi:hypothetical protein